MQAYLSQQENLTEPKILNDYALNGSDYHSDESMKLRRTVACNAFMKIEKATKDKEVKDYVL